MTSIVFIFALFGTAVAALYLKSKMSLEPQASTATPDPILVDETPNAPNSTPVAVEISYDVRTWPTGDRIWDVCRAIAIAEGANVQGSNPDKLNNPGDISDYAGTYGYELHSGSKVTRFPTKQLGWEKLYEKIRNVKNSTSSVYSPQMTWTQFAMKYAGNWQNWVNNVTRVLGVPQNSKVGDYLNG